MQVRGKRLTYKRHAADGMNCENPPIREEDVELAISDPDTDTGSKVTRWIGMRTVIVYYDEWEDEINVRSVSATKSRLDA